jgi:hypothetical protein
VFEFGRHDSCCVCVGDGGGGVPERDQQSVGDGPRFHPRKPLYVSMGTRVDPDGADLSGPSTRLEPRTGPEVASLALRFLGSVGTLWLRPVPELERWITACS